MAQCSKIKRDGKRCAMRARNGGEFCQHHDGTVNHVELGRKGGKVTAGTGEDRILAKAVSEDQGLREMARKVFRDALQSENPTERLNAARSLAAVAPEKPISEQQRKGWDTKHSGLPMKELLDSLRHVAGDEAIRLLPSPGEVLAPRTDDPPSTVPDGGRS